MTPEEEIQRLETRLAEFEEKLSDVSAHLERADPKLREAYAKELRVLEEKKQHAHDRLAELRVQKAESWADEDLRATVFEVFDEIGRRLSRLISSIPSRSRHR